MIIKPRLFKFSDILEHILYEDTEKEYKSAVAIVEYRDRWLLGMARNTGDDRDSKWVHPGGGIKKGETPEKAAERECFEETGIRCKAVGKAFSMSDRPGVAFVHCRATSGDQKFKPNSEFSALGFFTMAEIRHLKPLFKNVKKLIESVR
jgi:8-oxo-dGTP pyrophosphatase MutT (NUDIX family)